MPPSPTPTNGSLSEMKRTSHIQRALGGALVASLLTGVAMPAFAADYTLKIAHVVPQGDPRDTAARHVADLMNNSESCDVEAEVFPSAQLGTTTDLIEGMQLGSIEAVILPASFLVGFQPLMGIFDFPFYWPSETDKLVELHKSDAMRTLLETTNEQGVYSMDVWHTGYKQWTANAPLTSTENFAGKRARVMPSEILIEQQKALGLTPVTMPFPETYSALQSGAIDAQENPIPTIFTMRFQEVQSDLTMTNHGNLDQIFMVSKSWFDGLPADCQSELESAVDSGQELVLDETVKVEEKALTTFADQGIKITELTDEQRTALRDATLPKVKELYTKTNGDRGQEMIDLISGAISGK